MDQYVIIDGAKFEGGGQMMRLSLALSTLLQKPFKMSNIRKSRPNAGINNQLKNQIDLISPLVDAYVMGNKIGSTELEFSPKKPFSSQKLICKASSAHSITLVLQSLLPIALMTGKDTDITVQGGTYVTNSPPLKSWIIGFKDIIARMGVKFEIDIIRDGYYPQGGGMVDIHIFALERLQPLIMKEIQKIKRAELTYLVAKELNVNQYNKQIKKALAQFSDQVELISDIKLVNSKKFKQCYGICLVTSSECNIYDHSIIHGEDTPIEETVESLIEILEHALINPAAVDEFQQDQFLIFMALADGVSEIVINKPTEHLQSALYVLKQFIPNLDVQIEELEGYHHKLQVTGISYKHN